MGAATLEGQAQGDTLAAAFPTGLQLCVAAQVVELKIFATVSKRECRILKQRKTTTHTPGRSYQVIKTKTRDGP